MLEAYLAEGLEGESVFSLFVRRLPRRRFAGEPLLEVVAPLPQAQLVETMLMNQVHLQTVAGVDSTSNLLAGRVYGIPVAGTMAHSYVQKLTAWRDVLAAELTHGSASH